MTIVEASSGSVTDVLPAEYNARSGLYGYGGAAFDVLPDDRIIFAARGSSGAGVYLLDPSSRKVTPLLPENKVLEYGSFCPNASLPWVLAIEEDSTDPSPRGVQNYIAAINVETGKAHRVVEGADFYFQPRFSHDGTRLSWMQYNHPELPYTDARLHMADWDKGVVRNVRFVAGNKGESVAEPRWGPDGSLFFCKENGEGSYRQLYRIQPGSEEQEHIKLGGLENAEFGYAGHSEPMYVASAQVVANV